MTSLRTVFLVLSLLLSAMFVSNASAADTKLEATIFSYDGQDFVRTDTTLMQEGQSAEDTKLDMIARPTKPWPKNAPTAERQPSLVKNMTATTHQSPMQAAN